jgi:hypothetical protein
VSQASGKEERSYSSSLFESCPLGFLPRVGLLVGHRSTGACGFPVTGILVGNAVLVGFGEMLGAAVPGKKEKKKLHDDCND